MEGEGVGVGVEGDGWKEREWGGDGGGDRAERLVIMWTFPERGLTYKLSPAA